MWGDHRSLQELLSVTFIDVAVFVLASCFVQKFVSFVNTQYNFSNMELEYFRLILLIQMSFQMAFTLYLRQFYPL